MIGRGIFKNPWFFNKQIEEKSPEEKLSLLWKHAKLFADTWQNTKNFAIMRRFFKIYTYDFRHAAEIRAALMETKDIDDVKEILDNCPFEVKYEGG
jgi:tRNA-dihydrouridine synthase